MTVGRSAEFEGLPEEFSAALLFAAVVDSSEDAIVSQRLDGTIMSWSPAAESLFGWTAGEAIGQNFEMIVPEARRDEFSAITARLARGERVAHLETARTHRDGSEVQVSLTISPIHASDGLVVGSFGIAHDISDRERSEGGRASLSPILAPDGSIVGEAAVLHDITERKRRERDLAESRALLERAQRVGHIGGWISGGTPRWTA